MALQKKLPQGFDINSFLTTVYQKAGATKLPTVPQTEKDRPYYADIGEINKDSFVGISDDGQLVVRINFFIDDDKVRELTKMKKPRVMKQYYLTLGKNNEIVFDEGLNVDLGRLRAACKQNSSKNWKLQDLQGRRVKIHIVHKDNPDDADAPYVNISRIEAI